MDLDQPNVIEIAGQIIMGLVAVAAITGVMLLFGAAYYQAVGRVDWIEFVQR